MYAVGEEDGIWGLAGGKTEMFMLFGAYKNL
jgi:hypothetical protein